MTQDITRRELIRSAALAGGLAALGGVWGESAQAQKKGPNDKLNIAWVGIGGQGAGDVNNFSGENIVALCDVDEDYGAKTFDRFPKAKKYQDFRKMLDEMGKEIDAIGVSTPDHLHAIVSITAMKMGKHVYCQKPLTRTVSEARLMMQTARKHKVATQMGTQAHADGNTIRAVELLQAGAIGHVREVHIITDRPAGWWPQGVEKPKDTPPVPATLNWDLWLGPAADRPYNPAYLPFKWRGWWDFGTGSLGDMACHLMDISFWALKLGAPVTVEAEGDPLLPDSGPSWSIIHYAFPARGDMPAVTLHWYDGGKKPAAELAAGGAMPTNGSIYVGDKGRMLIEHTQPPKLLPEADFKDYKAPEQTIARPGSHYQQWAQACKVGSPTGSNFLYAANMTEAILLGNVAFRTGKKIEWDSRSMKAKGCPEADQYIQHHYRNGWSL